MKTVQKYDKVWKRWVTVTVAEEEPRPTHGYEQQLELELNKTVEATPEEVNEWQEKELDWWANKQFKFIIIASFVQLAALGFMFSVMFVADQWV